MVEGLHIMQTIRQFDQKHADIRGHRDQKFSGASSGIKVLFAAVTSKKL